MPMTSQSGRESTFRNPWFTMALLSIALISVWNSGESDRNVFAQTSTSKTSKAKKSTPSQKITKASAGSKKKSPKTTAKRKPSTRKTTKRSGQAKSKKPAKPKLPPLKTPADKRKFLNAIRLSMPTRRVGSKIRYLSDDLDKGLTTRIKVESYQYARPISDETFVRRAYLDLTDKVPSARVVKQFVANEDRKKRSALIDQLLETDDYARKWARYWRNVIFYNSAANKNRVNPQALEDWLTEQFKKDVSWDRITAELVSATPKFNKAQKENKNEWGQKTGPNNFVLACENKATELAAQTARIFMGISVQCAECHDHPFDQWKREQFHEMAAFFSRKKYYMTDQEDPAKRTEMQARFLLGEKPPEGLSTDQRRVAIAAYLIYNPDNYWFARAFVNRIWNELIGDGFYAVDSLGPDAEVIHKSVANRIAAVFRYKEFDPKWVFRLIMNSRTYQREIRTIESDDKLFTAVRPSRLRPEQVLASVEKITGANPNIKRMINRTFKVDPSIPQRDLEGSIQQALLMMNNGALQARLRNSTLKKQLVKIKSNREMVKELYLGILARTPTDAELQRSIDYLTKVRNRYEAIDDLIWVLVNSTEFTTKR